MNFELHPGQLQWNDVVLALNGLSTLSLAKSSIPAIHQAHALLQKTLLEQKTIYGVNTGFGILASERIDTAQLQQLQRNLILSHAAGTGELLPDDIVRLVMLLKINTLARGYSGVRLALIDLLIRFYNEGLYPCIPSQGSVGASGDLAPLAHLSMPLLGEGEVRRHGLRLAATDALRECGLAPLVLEAKEGLALVNGTQVSTGIALAALSRIMLLCQSALVTGAMSVDAAKGSVMPFATPLQQVRNHEMQIKVAACLRQLLGDSEILRSHQACNKVQDPYSLRCQPQVMGACATLLAQARATLMTEANAVSDNPLVFCDDNAILSGGNFHAEPVALAADQCALATAEIGSLAERRIALLMDNRFSGLPMFLVSDSGLNSGLMLAQVTAAALATENKCLSRPVSIESLPTSANQEDHVSMSTYAAYRLFKMADNLEGILAIECLVAAQGIELHRPLRSSAPLQQVIAQLREKVAFLEQDRCLALDIQAAREVIKSLPLSEVEALF